MSSKLGGHFMSGGDPQPWITAGAKIFKFTPEILGASSAIPAGPLVIGKLDQEDPAIGITDWKALMKQGFTSVAAADLRFNAQTNINVGANKPPVNRYTANPRIDVWEDDNEVVPDDGNEALWYSDYCIEMMKLYETIAKKRANFSFAVGTPKEDIWPYLLPAIIYARDHGHYLALHEYMGYEADYGVGWKQVDANRQPTIDVWHGRPDHIYPWGWAALRYRYIYDELLIPAGVGDVRLLITEAGCDSVESVTPMGMPTGSWKSMGLSPLEYTDMLMWYDARVREDPYVIGATIFTVGSVAGWDDWDIKGTLVESDIVDYIEEELDTDDSTVPPPPLPSVINLLPNSELQDGWTDSEDWPMTTQDPKWYVSLWNEGANSFAPDQPYIPGEGVFKLRSQIPLEEWPLFFEDDNEFAYKIFKDQAPYWFRIKLKTPMALPAGKYMFSAKWFNDTYEWVGYKKYTGLDANQVQVMLKVNQVVVSDWDSMDCGVMIVNDIAFEHAGGLFDPAFHMRSNFGISGNFWLRKLGLFAIPDPVTPPPPPSSGKQAIVVKMPQDCTLEEAKSILEQHAHLHRRSFVYSHDDTRTILLGGNDTSFVEFAWPERQEDVVTLVDELGYTWVSLTEPPDPLADLVLEHPFEYRYLLTSSFDAPRTYANGKHEGVDYDISGGILNNTTDVLCCYPGVVDRSLDSDGGYGKYVRVKHIKDGMIFFTRYCHLDARFVQVGQAVLAGTALGEIGSTGNVTGEHLHLNLEVPGRGLSGYVVADVLDPNDYVRSGRSLLPQYQYNPLPTAFDVLPYLKGDGRLYELRHADGQQERLQSQYDAGSSIFYQTKNSAWEEFWFTSTFIYRDMDTSPGPDAQGRPRFYTQREPDLNGARWCPRWLFVGQAWVNERNHFVQFYHKETCEKLPESTGEARNHITLVAKHSSRTWNGVTVNDIIELTDGIERWFYAKGFGLVAWSNGLQESAISEIHAPGTRPDNVREKIVCFS